MNSCVYRNSSGHMFLTFHSEGGANGTCIIDQWKAYYTQSADGGQTWSNQFATLPGCPGCMGCVKNQCVKLSNGEVLCPSSDESVPYDSAHFETTDEAFSHFVRHDSIYFFYSDVTKLTCEGIIQPVIFEIKPGVVLALFRTQGCGVIAQAISYDYGHTWPKYATTTQVANPGAGIDGTVMRGFDQLGLLLAYNNNTDVRSPLSLGHSVDQGQSWQHIVDVETDTKGSFAYPFVIQSRHNPKVAHMCYSYDDNNLTTIAYTKLDWS